MVCTRPLLCSVCAAVLLIFASVSPVEADALREARRGYEALQKGEYDKGIAHLTRAIQSKKLQDKNLPIAYFNRGNAWFHKQEYDKAVKDLNEAIQLDSSFAEAWLKRGQVWKKMNEPSKALEDLNQAILLDELNPKGYFLRGLIHSVNGDADRAMEDFADATRLDPRFIISPLLQAVLDVGEEFGIKFMTKALESDKLGPTNLALTFYYRGLAWYSLGGYEQAIDDYTNAIVQNPSLEQAYAARGDAWRQKDAFAQAIADYTKAISMQPGNATLHYARGYALSLEGNHTLAKTDFETALQIDPTLEMPDIEALKEHQGFHKSQLSTRPGEAANASSSEE